MIKHLPSLGLCLLVLYLCAHTSLYHFRHPAANLAYWCYIPGGRKTETLERCTYFCFYPIYFVHQRFLGAGRHAWDRPVPYSPLVFRAELILTRIANPPASKDTATALLFAFAHLGSWRI